MDCEITEEAEIDPSTPDEVQEKHERVYYLIREDEMDEAEQLPDEIIAVTPALPSAYNHLALVFQKQVGRSGRAKE